MVLKYFSYRLLICLGALIGSAFQAGATIDASLQMQLGNPSNASADTNNHDHYLIQRTVETIDYSDHLGEPNWASWDLTAGDIGTSGRSLKFFDDTNLPPNFYVVPNGSYSGSGYDRGHMCPSDDRTDNTNDNNLVFFMSNMVPQTASLNSGIWGNFEGYCRSLVQSASSNELLIICGPSGFTGALINTNGPVKIPQYCWKVVVIVSPGTGTALSRITATNRVIAIKVPNTNGVSATWQNFITSARQIEVDTGLTFFTALPAGIANILRNKVDGQTNAPPAIFSFSPTNGTVGTAVTITGSNFISASAVTFNGTSATFSLDASNQITAFVPTNSSSGFISVTTSSGTAVSTNNFTTFNTGVSIYSGVLAGWDMTGLTNYGASPLPVTTNAANLTAGGLTRGSGVKLSGTAAAGGWGGTGFVSTSAVAAVTANLFATFNIMATNGWKVSFSSVSQFNYYRSPSGPPNGVLQYQIGSGAFNTITNLAYPTTSSGATIGAIDLSAFADLQNVGANTNVTFRIVNYGGTSSGGTWYIYNTGSSSSYDLAIQGSIIQVLTTNAPAAAPTFSLLTFTNHQFQFTLTGTATTNYVVQACTNLASPIWVSLTTNAAPFVFVESNADSFGQRFYRGVIAP